VLRTVLTLLFSNLSCVDLNLTLSPRHKNMNLENAFTKKYSRRQVVVSGAMAGVATASYLLIKIGER
jgi:hypothetical protein